MLYNQIIGKALKNNDLRFVQPKYFSPNTIQFFKYFRLAKFNWSKTHGYRNNIRNQNWTLVAGLYFDLLSIDFVGEKLETLGIRGYVNH